MNNKNQESEIKRAKEQGFEQAFNLFYGVMFISAILTLIIQ